MIRIAPGIYLSESEIVFTFIRSPGPGGQNVNKLATTALLRFNVKQSSLPEEVRQRLIALAGSKLTQQGELLIKASRFRTQERNKQDALERLQTLLSQAAIPPKKRRKTRPTLASKHRRLDTKKLRSKTKALRQNKME